MKRPLAVTGGVASGKSTVGGMFRELGYSVVDADDVGREVFQRGEVQDWLRGELRDVEDLRESVRERLGDASFRTRLNSVTHPLIMESLEQSGADVLEIPLLVEAGLVSAFGAVVVCDCPAEITLQRLTVRLGDEGQAKKIIASQVDSGVRKSFGDWIIRTDGELDTVFQVVKTVAENSL